jgi:hypothetical protein
LSRQERRGGHAGKARRSRPAVMQRRPACQGKDRLPEISKFRLA